MTETLLAVRPVAGSTSGGKSGGGSGGSVPSEDPNTLRSNTTARVLDLISAGPVRGLVDGAKSIFFDGTPMQNEDGSYNFSGVSWDQRYGLPDQDYMPGFSAAEQESVVNVEIKHATPIVRTFAGPIDALRVTLSVPQLTYQDPTTGNMHGSSVALLIERRPSGTSTWESVKTVTIEGKCVSTYQTAHRIELGGEGDWDVRVSRVTADSTQVNLINATWWALATRIVDGKFQYNDSAYVGLTVDAQQFGNNAPTRAYELYGINEILVPVNYDPETRTYSGIWNGQFKAEYSDNPAWIYYYLLTSRRNGIGDRIDAAKVDKWALYQIARHCDELVPDGFGGMEPRYRFAYQFMASEDAVKVLQSIAASFRGQTYWSGGQLVTFADMPTDPAQDVIVSQANIKDGIITYEGVGYSARHSVAIVTWYDPSNQCKPTPELVEDPDLIAKYGWKPLNITAVGCCWRGQAHRMGKWALDTEKTGTITANYEAGWDHVSVVPGDIISVYDPHYESLRLSGRTVASDSNSLTVDAPILIADGVDYTLRVLMPDMTLAERTLNNFAGETDVLTFDDPLPQQPVSGAVWAVTASNRAPRQFRVLSVKETQPGLFAVTALFHDPTKFARVEQDIKLEAPLYSPYVNTAIPAPINLALQQYVYRANGNTTPSATISWQAPASELPVAAFQLQIQPPDGNWGNVISLRVPSYDLIGLVPGRWNIRVRCVSFTGAPGPWATISRLLNVSSNAPSDVTGFTMSLIGDMAVFKWDQPAASEDVDHYRMKFEPVTAGAGWASSIDLFPNLSGTTAQAPAMVGTYLLKAVNSAGYECANAALAVTTSAALAGIDTIETYDDAPTWSGAKTNMVVVGSVLQLDTNPDGTVMSEGYYEIASSGDLGAVYAARLTAQVTAAGDNAANVMAKWDKLSDVESLSAIDPGQWGLELQLRITQDDPASPSAAWTNYNPFVVGDYTHRAWKLGARVTSNNANVNVKISSLAMIVGMKRRTESHTLTTDAAGSTVTFAPAFYETPDFIFTPHDLPAGGRFDVTGKSATGCTVRCYNSSGTGISCTGTVAAHGHGYAAS